METQIKPSRKTIKKAIRIGIYALVVLLLIPLLCSFLLLIPSIQKAVVDEVLELTTDFLHADISIDAIYFKPFQTLELDGILVLDHKADTLLFAEELDLKLKSYDLELLKLEFGLSRLYNAEFNLIIYKNDSISNLQHIIRELKFDESSKGEGVKLTLDNVEVDKLVVRNHDWNTSKSKDHKIDFKHLDVRNIYGSISEINIDNSITGKVDDFRFEERSGFLLRYLNGDFTVNDSSVVISSLNLVTNRTVVQGGFKMRFRDFSDFKEFNHEVEIESHFTNSRIDFRDVGYFASNVKNLFARVNFTGTANGTIDDLAIGVDSLLFGDQSELIGYVKLKGLPVLDELLIQSQFERLYVTPTDFEKLVFPTAGGGASQIGIPQELDAVQYALFNGSFNGFVKDFVSFGRLRTNLGVVDADLHFELGDDLHYTGNLSSNDLAIASFAEGGLLGSVGFDVDVAGGGLSPDSVELQVVGEVHHFDLNGYRYQNLVVNSSYSGQVFENNLQIDDPIFSSDLFMSVDLSGNITHTELKGKVSRALLDRMNFGLDTATSLATDIDLDFYGNKIKDLNGYLRLEDITFITGAEQLTLDSLVFREFLVKGKRKISIETEVANIDVFGQTSLIDIPYALRTVGSRFAPELFNFSVPDTTNKFQVFDFNVDVKNEASFVNFLNPKLELANPVKLSGNLNMMDRSFTLSSNTIDWAMKELKAEQSTIVIQPEGDSLLATVSSNRVNFSDDYFLENIALRTALFNDSLLTRLNWNNETEQADSGSISVVSFNNDDYTYNSVLQGLNMQIAGVEWYSTNSAKFSLDTNRLSITDFELRSKNGAITCDGDVSRGGTDHIKLEVENFDMSYFSNFGLIQNDIQGVLNGEVDMFEAQGVLSANVTIEADSLIIDGLEVGKLSGSSRYSNEKKNLNLDVDLFYRGERNVKLYGDFYPQRKEEQLELRLQVDKFRLALLEPFIEKQLSEMSGEVDGTIDLTGNTTKMFLDGSLSLSEFVGKVGYLKTKYSIPKGDIIFESNFIGMDAVKIIDGKGSEGFLTATIFHDNFHNFNYDIYVNANNFTALNTTSADNSSYYGTANITGDVSISGYQGMMGIEVVAKTNKATKLNIPLNEGGDVSELEYIRFVHPKNPISDSKERYNVLDAEIQGLNLNFQLEVTDDAELQIIFDEKIGDVVKVKGVGDILMEIDNRGTFAMYGAYQISQGDYLFTLQNVVNKRFDVRPGSRIVWNGSPYDAQIDLTAIYGLTASPAPIAASVGDTSEVYKKRMQTDVYLNMKGALLEPIITFDIDLPSLPESDIVSQLLDPGVTSEQDMNEQVFALLLAGTFFNSQAGIGGFKTGQRTTYEMVSNQFSNWLSQYFEDTDVIVNYRPSDVESKLGSQTEVMVRRKFLNERALLEVNGSVQGQDGSSTDETTVAGEFNLEVKINEEGTFRARVFNEANNYNPINLNQSPYTQGVGLFYRKEFGKIGDLFGRKKQKESESLQK